MLRPRSLCGADSQHSPDSLATTLLRARLLASLELVSETMQKMLQRHQKAPSKVFVAKKDSVDVNLPFLSQL